MILVYIICEGWTIWLSRKRVSIEKYVWHKSHIVKWISVHLGESHIIKLLPFRIPSQGAKVNFCDERFSFMWQCVKWHVHFSRAKLKWYCHVRVRNMPWYHWVNELVITILTQFKYEYLFATINSILHPSETLTKP